MRSRPCDLLMLQGHSLDRRARAPPRRIRHGARPAQRRPSESRRSRAGAYHRRSEDARGSIDSGPPAAPERPRQGTPPLPRPGRAASPEGSPDRFRHAGAPDAGGTGSFAPAVRGGSRRPSPGPSATGPAPAVGGARQRGGGRDVRRRRRHSRDRRRTGDRRAADRASPSPRPASSTGRRYRGRLRSGPPWPASANAPTIPRFDASPQRGRRPPAGLSSARHSPRRTASLVDRAGQRRNGKGALVPPERNRGLRHPDRRAAHGRCRAARPRLRTTRWTPSPARRRSRRARAPFPRSAPPAAPALRSR